VPGALLAFGDAHGAQGDGEITGVAVEIEAEVELTVRVRDREEAGFVSLPQLDTAAAIGSLAGLQGASLTGCARAAYLDLVQRLVRGPASPSPTPISCSARPAGWGSAT
jgi:amidase